jgi:4-amino-4-deoxy-L-arabinose transferase-like glycosyltransferase
MSRWLWSKKKEYILLLVIACVSLLLLLANLGNQYLWQDEAQTALISKTILTEGVPRGYDGKNYFSQEAGAEYGENYIWRWHTWLPFYVLAGFYKVFGIGTLVSRLPFVLFGFGTVLLIFFFARSLWPGTSIPVIAAGLLSVSVPFLILSRQCRYYSMAMFFSVLALYSYIAMQNSKRYAGVMFFVASTLLFHTQHFYLIVLFATVLLHAVIFVRRNLKILLVAIILTIIVNIPWLVWFYGMGYTKTFISLQRPIVLYSSIKCFLVIISRYVFPVWLWGIVLITAIIRLTKTGHIFSRVLLFRGNILLQVFFIAFNIISMSILTPVPYFRYIAPSIPLLIMLIAVIINAAGREHLILAVLVVVTLVATSQIGDYFYEITHDYEGPEKGIARYLNKYGSPDDIVAITYGDMGLKFYTKMRVVGGLTGEDLAPAKNVRWVIIRKYIHLKIDKKVAEYLIKNIEWDKYRKLTINYPDIPWENRESPDGHLFRTCTDEDKVVIYEKIN